MNTQEREQISQTIAALEAASRELAKAKDHLGRIPPDSPPLKEYFRGWIDGTEKKVLSMALQMYQLYLKGFPGE